MNEAVSEVMNKVVSEVKKKKEKKGLKDSHSHAHLLQELVSLFVTHHDLARVQTHPK